MNIARKELRSIKRWQTWAALLLLSSRLMVHGQAPAITVQPTNTYASQYSTPTFTVTASGSQPLRYQWRFGGTPLAGATSSSFTLKSAQFTNAGNYQVVVTNSLGSRTSAVAVLVVGSVAAWGKNDDGECNLPPGLTNALSVAGGLAYSVALLPDGTLQPWGLGAGALNLGQTNLPPNLTNVAAIAAGAYHCLALRQDGSLGTWGNNTSGETNIPPGLTNVLNVTAGNGFSAAARADGSVVTWGTNSFHQLDVPPWLHGVVALAAGDSHLLALRVDGTVVAWGLNLSKQTNVPANLSNVVAVAAGGNNSMALKADGTVVGWGAHQLVIPGGLNNIVAIACGNLHSLALGASGSITGWGNDGYGAALPPPWLSNAVSVAAGGFHGLALQGARPPQLTLQPLDWTVSAGNPILLSGRAVGLTPAVYQWQFNGVNLPGATNANLTLTNPQAADAGGYTLIAGVGAGALTSRVATVTIRPQKTLAAWGNRGSGATFTPVGLSNVVAVRAGASHTLALKEDGTVLSWGGFNGGQSLQPQNLSNVVAIAAGSSHNVALRADGSTISWAWYSSSSSSLTNSSATHNGLVAIAAGNAFNLGLRGDGTVTVWGNPSQATSVLTVPAGLTGVQAIAAGDSHCLALKADGTVVGWGSNARGRATVPTSLTNVIAIAAGGYHSLALKRDGTITAWGWDAFGQIDVPPNLSNVVAIAAGFDHSLALRSDGTVVTWGLNAAGKEQVPAGLTNVTAIAAGYFHSVALVGASAPCIGTQPAGLTTPSGSSATLQASTAGTPPLAVQWRFEGGNLPGATNLSLVLSNIQAVNAGDYTLVISNVLGQTTSQVATVTLGPIIGWGNHGDTQTSPPPGLVDPVAVAAGFIHSLVLRADGSVIGFGDDDSGECDIPAALTNATAITAGNAYSMGLRADGVPFVWGSNNSGQTNVPPGLSGIRALAAGNYTCLALGSNGLITAWGGLVGPIATTTNVPAGLSNVVAIAAGGLGFDYFLALTAQGTVSAWGPGAPASMPAGLSNVVAISAGGSTAFALRSDGTVIAWPANSLAVFAAGLSNIVALSAGGEHTLALQGNGNVIAWGDNRYGEITLPAGLLPARSVSAGELFSLAITGDGRPFITAPPFSQTVNVGDSFTLNILAGGQPPLRYQWQVNGVDLPGASNTSLLFTNVPLTAAGDYRCLVSNALGQAISATATVTVTLMRPPLVFDLSPGGLQMRNGFLQMNLTGLSGHGAVVISTSTNLVDWSPIFTNPPTSGSLPFQDAVMPAGQRFYRATEQ